jgi:hypothetical protein
MYYSSTTQALSWPRLCRSAAFGLSARVPSTRRATSGAASEVGGYAGGFTAPFRVVGSGGGVSVEVVRAPAV